MQTTTRMISLAGGMCATVEIGMYGQTTIVVHALEGSRVFEGYSEAEAMERMRLAGYTVVADVPEDAAIKEIYHHVLGLSESAAYEACPPSCDVDAVGTAPSQKSSADVWPWPSHAVRPDSRENSSPLALREYAFANNDFNPDFDPGFMGEHC